MWNHSQKCRRCVASLYVTSLYVTSMERTHLFMASLVFALFFGIRADLLAQKKKTYANNNDIAFTLLNGVKWYSDEKTIRLKAIDNRLIVTLQFDSELVEIGFSNTDFETTVTKALKRKGVILH